MSYLDEDSRTEMMAVNAKNAVEVAARKSLDAIREELDGRAGNIAVHEVKVPMPQSPCRQDIDAGKAIMHVYANFVAQCLVDNGGVEDWIDVHAEACVPLEFVRMPGGWCLAGGAGIVDCIVNDLVYEAVDEFNCPVDGIAAMIDRYLDSEAEWREERRNMKKAA